MNTKYLSSNIDFAFKQHRGPQSKSKDKPAVQSHNTGGKLSENFISGKMRAQLIY